MKILIIGGTVFLGRALVEAAAAREHRLTLFNRGQTNSDLFPDVEKLRGNRDGDLSALSNRHWDAVVDTCGYLPRIVRQSVNALRDSVERYVFISSLSVYSDIRNAGVDENGKLGTLEDETVETITGDTYGPLKVLCEKEAQKVFADRALIIRPGLIVGQNDPTDRFTYWVNRLARGGDTLIPGRPARAIQFIDVRDLAEWTIKLIENKRSGVYNANGPEKVLTMAEFVESCVRLSGSLTKPIWVRDEILVELGLTPWTEGTLWIPETDESSRGFFAFDCRKAINDGLTFRALDETVKATLEWDRTRPVDRKWKAGITKEREEELLRKVVEMAVED